MDKIYKFSPEIIEGCIENTSKKHNIKREDLLILVEKRYRGISNYLECNIRLYIQPNPNIVFFYYSGSKDTKPGLGSGETIDIDGSKFEELASYKDWRKMLSNFWVCEFKLDGLRWASVEHYYQGSKFRKTKSFFEKFSIDSKSEISKDPLIAKAAGGKSGKYKGRLMRSPVVVIDSDFFGPGTKAEKQKILCDINMYRAMYAKFSQNEDLKKVLLATLDSTLTHGTRGVPTKPIYTLMKVREDISEQ